MPKKSKITGKTRLDKFYHLAKEQGFRSRAAFKLIQLNRKYDFLSSARALIDLCAAPGGWLQVAAKNMPVSSLIVGVDLDPIKPIPNVQTFQQDITTAACRSQLKAALQHWQADVVLNDGSPNVGGAWTKDAYGQAELSLAALKLAVEFLRSGGMFVTKVFRSQDSNSLLWVCRQLFNRVDVTKPSASRGTSAEIYFVCQGFKAPEKTDPRLFDPEHVFKNIDQDQSTVNVLRDAPHKQKRHRNGYEDGVMLLHKSLSLTQFLVAATPSEILARFNEITITTETELALKAHPATTEDILHSCTDLKVLGRKEFKTLIQWRRSLKAYCDGIAKDLEHPDDHDESVVEAEDDAETCLARENKQLEEYQKRLLSKEKREKRKRKEQKTKTRQRQLGMVAVDDGEDQDDALFTLSSIRNASDLTKLDKGEAVENDVDDVAEVVILNDAGAHSQAEDGGESDSSDNSELDMQLEAQYAAYKSQRGIVERTRPVVGLIDDEYKENLAANDSSQDDEDDEDISDRNPLKDDLSHLTKVETGSVQTDRWFSRDIFESINQIPIPVAKPKRVNSGSNHNDVEQDMEDAMELVNNMTNAAQNEGDVILPQKPLVLRNPAHARGTVASADDFEIVAAERSDQDDDLSTDCEAEMLALGKQMLRKRRRQEIEDASYNRHAWQDDKDLPSWFRDDQQQHNRPILPVKKSDIDEMKARLAAINARPIKKIAEARARKKMASVKRWEKVKSQADNIAASELPEKEKFKRLGSLYESSAKTHKKKTEKQYVVNRKGTGAKASEGPRKKGARLKMVDARMKADKRGRKATERKAKKSKKSPTKKKSTHKKK